MSIEDSILDFRNLYEKTREHEMNLPEAIRAFRLLDGANLVECPKIYPSRPAIAMEFRIWRVHLK